MFDDGAAALLEADALGLSGILDSEGFVSPLLMLMFDYLTMVW